MATPGSRSCAATITDIFDDTAVNTYAPNNAATNTNTTPPNTHDGRFRFGGDADTTGTSPSTDGRDTTARNEPAINTLPAQEAAQYTTPTPAPQPPPTE